MTRRSAGVGAATSGSRESWAPTAGFLAVGVSAFAMLAAGPRLLGDEEYSGLAVAWTVATIFGFGLAIPAEQTITRRIAGGDGAGIQRVRVALLMASLPVGIGWMLACNGWSIALDRDPRWWLAAWIACVGWATVVGPRGRLAGAGLFERYAGVLITDGIIRILLVAVALVAPERWQPDLLAGAVGLPIFVATLVATVTARTIDRHAPGARQSFSPEGLTREPVALVIVALAMQVLLSTAPLWLAARPEVAPTIAGLFVSVTSYMRIPALLTGGALTVVLSRSSSHYATGNLKALRSALMDHVKPIAAITSVAAVVLVAASPIGLLLLYGSSPNVGIGTLVLIGATTVVFGVANVVTQSVVGMRGATAMAWIWCASAAVATLLLALLPASIMGASWAILAGVMVGSIGVAWRLRSAFVGGDRMTMEGAPDA